jgi:cytoskeletal protein CcmA (bactofilin family)
MIRDKTKQVEVTILSKGMKLTGELQTTSDIRIEGVIYGPVISIAKIFVDAGALVVGDLTAKNLELHGRCQGNVAVDEHVIMGEFSEFEGDISCRSIEIRKGSKFRGKLFSHEQGVKKSSISDKDKIINIKPISHHLHEGVAYLNDILKDNSRKAVNDELNDGMEENEGFWR